MEERKLALIALLLVGLAPTVSIFISFGTDGGIISQIAYFISKFWLFAIPLIWYLKVDRGKLSFSKPKQGGYAMAIGLGLGMSSLIFGAWFVLGGLIDGDLLKDAVEPVGLLDVRLYIGGVIYWTVLNSLLEEYVFRWFITTKSAEIFDSEMTGIIFSALMFTLHHAIALHLFGFVWWQTVLASFGLISAAIIWSWLYIKYRSIWVCWLSHAICDVAVFGIGYIILF